MIKNVFLSKGCVLFCCYYNNNYFVDYLSKFWSNIEDALRWFTIINKSTWIHYFTAKNFLHYVIYYEAFPRSKTCKKLAKHTSVIVVATMNKLKLPPQASYSWDLVPSNCFLFLNDYQKSRNLACSWVFEAARWF